MQIHELNTGTPASNDYLAMDTGSDTYKAKPGDMVPSYTSGDDASPTAWTNVTAVGSGLSFSTLIARITTMMKNVRFLYGLLGVTDISNIGNGTVTDALSTLDGKATPTVGTVGSIETVTLGANTTLHKIGDLVVFNIDASTSENIPAGGSGSGFVTFPSGFRPSASKSFIGRTGAGTSGEYLLSSGGNFQILANPISSGSTFRISGSFVAS